MNNVIPIVKSFDPFDTFFLAAIVNFIESHNFIKKCLNYCFFNTSYNDFNP